MPAPDIGAVGLLIPKRLSHVQKNEEKLLKDLSDISDVATRCGVRYKAFFSALLSSLASRGKIDLETDASCEDWNKRNADSGDLRSHFFKV